MNESCQQCALPLVAYVVSLFVLSFLILKSTNRRSICQFKGQVRNPKFLENGLKMWLQSRVYCCFVIFSQWVRMKTNLQQQSIFKFFSFLFQLTPNQSRKDARMMHCGTNYVLFTNVLDFARNQRYQDIAN